MAFILRLFPPARSPFLLPPFSFSLPSVFFFVGFSYFSFLLRFSTKRASLGVVAEHVGENNNPATLSLDSSRGIKEEKIKFRIQFPKVPMRLNAPSPSEKVQFVSRSGEKRTERTRHKYSLCLSNYLSVRLSITSP